jgi:hypothetical protein
LERERRECPSSLVSTFANTVSETSNCLSLILGSLANVTNNLSLCRAKRESFFQEVSRLLLDDVYFYVEVHGSALVLCLSRPKGLHLWQETSQKLVNCLYLFVSVQHLVKPVSLGCYFRCLFEWKLCPRSWRNHSWWSSCSWKDSQRYR